MHMPTSENRIKIAARYAVSAALRRGDIRKQPCEICGSEHSEAHHEDYAKPLTVKWLCRQHHVAQHCGSRMTRQMIQFTDPQHPYLRSEAKRLGLSIAELVRRIIDEHIAAAQ